MTYVSQVQPSRKKPFTIFVNDLKHAWCFATPKVYQHLNNPLLGDYWAWIYSDALPPFSKLTNIWIQRDENQRCSKKTFGSILVPTGDFILFQLSHPVFNNSVPFHPVPLLLFHSTTVRVSNPCTYNPSTSCSSTYSDRIPCYTILSK